MAVIIVPADVENVAIAARDEQREHVKRWFAALLGRINSRQEATIR
jgi:hypothetical protein